MNNPQCDNCMLLQSEEPSVRQRLPSGKFYCNDCDAAVARAMPPQKPEALFTGPEIHIYTHVQKDGTIGAVQVCAFGRVQRVDFGTGQGLGDLDLPGTFQALCLRALGCADR